VSSYGDRAYTPRIPGAVAGREQVFMKHGKGLEGALSGGMGLALFFFMSDIAVLRLDNKGGVVRY